MIVFLGSPLIDVTVRVDSSILKKYNLEPNNACIMSQTNGNLLEDIETLGPTIKVGGSVTNTARVFNKLLQQCGANDKSLECLYLGSIGCDEYGKLIKKQLANENLGFKLAEIVEQPTGKVVVLLTGESRSLVTDLGASKFLSISDLEGNAWDSIIQSEFLYVSAFFISVSFEIITKLFEYFNMAKKRICMNLGAPFLCQKYNSQINFMFANSQVVVGNEAEYRNFAKIHNTEQNDLKQTLINTNRLFDDDQRFRILIATNGHKNVMVAAGGEIEEFEVPTVENVVDTNGAGDAFVGGFLALYVRGKDLSECVKFGIKIAGTTIQSFGFDLAYQDAN